MGAQLLNRMHVYNGLLPGTVVQIQNLRNLIPRAGRHEPTAPLPGTLMAANNEVVPCRSTVRRVRRLRLDPHTCDPFLNREHVGRDVGKKRRRCPQWLILNDLDLLYGGERGIRTPGSLSTSTVFKTAALNHSAISPSFIGGGPCTPPGAPSLALRSGRHSYRRGSGCTAEAPPDPHRMADRATNRAPRPGTASLRAIHLTTVSETTAAAPAGVAWSTLSR